jgi:hypothetical protein
MDIAGARCRELKSKAVREKVSVKQLILRGVEVELRARSNKANTRARSGTEDNLQGSRRRKMTAQK